MLAVAAGLPTIRSLAPYGLITCLLSLYRNKKANQFVKLIRRVSLFVILYNLNTLIALAGIGYGDDKITIFFKSGVSSVLFLQ